MSGEQKKYAKECPICHNIFEGIKAKEYCSKKCRAAAHYIRSSNKIFEGELVPRKKLPRLVFKHTSGNGGYWAVRKGY